MKKKIVKKNEKMEAVKEQAQELGQFNKGDINTALFQGETPKKDETAEKHIDELKKLYK